jgi:biotin carboxylase
MNSQSSKRLMIIGSGWEQIPLIESAKANGYYVVATNPYPVPEVLKLVDTVERLDPRDLTKAVYLAEKYEVNGVTADQCDYSRYAAVYVTNQLDHRHKGNFLAAQLTTNKKWMRERCLARDVLQPAFSPCSILEQAHDAAMCLGFPLVVKPVDNRGSFGVQIVGNIQDLAAAFFYAIANSHSREVLIESYIKGTHVTVDGCIDQQGRHHNLAVATKEVAAGPTPIITEVYYPARLPKDMIKHIQITNTKVIDALDITDGLTHSEYIVDENGNCFLVEAANRGGGVLTSGKIIPLLTDVDVSGLLIANAMGEAFSVRPYETGVHVKLGFFTFKPGKAREVNGVESAMRQEGTVHIRLSIQPGNSIDLPRSGAGRHGFAIVKGRSEKEVRARFESLQTRISIVYEN